MTIHDQPADSPLAGGAPTVLLAEDNPDDALLTRRAFAKCGSPAVLQVVADGQHAVDRSWRTLNRQPDPRAT